MRYSNSISLAYALMATEDFAAASEVRRQAAAIAPVSLQIRSKFADFSNALDKLPEAQKKQGAP